MDFPLNRPCDVTSLSAEDQLRGERVRSPGIRAERDWFSEVVLLFGGEVSEPLCVI